MEQRLSEGWKYGEVKDIENKISPCLVEYEKLSKEQLVKDEIFIILCKAFTPFL